MKCLVSVMKKVRCAPYMSTVSVIQKKKNNCSIKNLRDPDIFPEPNRLVNIHVPIEERLLLTSLKIQTVSKYKQKIAYLNVFEKETKVTTYRNTEVGFDV